MGETIKIRRPQCLLCTASTSVEASPPQAPAREPLSGPEKVGGGVVVVDLNKRRFLQGWTDDEEIPPVLIVKMQQEVPGGRRATYCL